MPIYHFTPKTFFSAKIIFLRPILFKLIFGVETFWRKMVIWRKKIFGVKKYWRKKFGVKKLCSQKTRMLADFQIPTL